jgi:hypothetical protein
VHLYQIELAIFLHTQIETQKRGANMKRFITATITFFAIAAHSATETNIKESQQIVVNSCEYNKIDSSWTVDSSKCPNGVSCIDTYENTCNGETFEIHKFCVKEPTQCPR